ncbi:hypothetical protein JCM10212_004133 [Sporobolomyces blumeae]
MATAQLESLLAPPRPDAAQRAAHEFLHSSVSSPSTSTSPRNLGSVLSGLLKEHQHRQTSLERELAQSERKKDELLKTVRDNLESVKSRSVNLRTSHQQLRTDLIEVKSQLASDLDSPPQRAGEGGGAGQATLRERLIELATRRKQLERARKWFAVVAKAEELGTNVLRSLEANALPQAFRAYVGLVDYIKLVYREAEATKVSEGAGARSSGMVALTTQLVGMAHSVWGSLVKTLSTRLLSKLEALGWPQPFAEPLDPYEDPKVAEFQTAFVDLLTLELLQNNNVLPGPASKATQRKKPKPLLALVPLVHPLLMRFKWQFDGDRTTNRIDKPEYPLSHVLNLLTAHERFLSEDIQYLLSTNGFEDVDAVNEFTSLLLPPLASRFRHHLPQLVDLPPILAHTVYQVVEFDQVLRGRGYRPRTKQAGSVQQEDEEEPEWEGLCEVILGRREWFERWLEGEREFFDTRYYAAIGAPDAWHVLSVDDFDASTSTTGTRPTQSALRVKELAEQLSTRYRPLPLRHTVPFVLTLHLPLLRSYAGRITSSLDAFESLSFGILPGALGQSTAATQGVGGVVRLIRAGVSARWMAECCDEWGEDAFFLQLYSYLESALADGRIEDPDHQALAEEVLDNSDGTLFDREKKSFEDLADRSEDLIVRHCTREVVGELKPYFGRRFDIADDEGDPNDLSLTQELLAPLSLLSSLLKALVEAYPPSTLSQLYRRIAQSLSRALLERLYVSHSWTEAGARQLEYDLAHGFLVAAREAGVGARSIARGWEVALGGAQVLALPTQASQQGNYNPGGEWTFPRVMKVAWDEEEDDGDDGEDEGAFSKMMEDLGVGEALSRSEVRSLLRRRPECWR